MDNENWVEFSNVIKMDDENIEKFKKLYGEGQRFFIANTTLCETKISFSQIIPEPSRDNADRNWADNSNQDVGVWRKKDTPDENSALDGVIGSALKMWRMDNWGTPSDVLYESEEVPFMSLDGLLKGEFPFFTYSKPPIKVYEKMTLKLAAHEFLDPEESSDDRPTIVAKNREHLDQLIQCVQEYLKTELYLQGTFGLIREILGNTIVLDNVLDLNFIDVSSVTDLSDLFANFDVSPCPEKGWFCKIRLDICKWNVSSETKMTHLFDNDRVDLGDFRKWDTSRANKVWDDIESYYNFGFNIILNFKDKHSGSPFTIRNQRIRPKILKQHQPMMERTMTFLFKLSIV